MSARTRLIACVVASVALMAGFWMLVLAPKRTQISAATEQIAQAESRRDAALTGAAQAERARAGYLRDNETVVRLGKAVPTDDDVASLVYQLESIARANKIDFRAVKLTGAAGAPPADAPADAPAADKPAGTDDEKADSADKGAAPAPAPVVGAPAVSQTPPGAVVGSAGLLTVPFTLTFDGNYMKLQRLLKAINGLAKNDKRRITVQGRLLTIDGFSLAAAPKGFPKLQAVVSATAYLAPPVTSVSPAAQSPAGGASATDSTAIVTPDPQVAGG